MASVRSAPGPSTAAEYLAAVLTTRAAAAPARQPEAEELLRGFQLDRVGEIVNDIYAARLVERSERDRKNASDAASRARMVFVLQGSSVAAVSYGFEEERFLVDLFARFDSVLKERIGFEIGEAIAMVEGVHKLRSFAMAELSRDRRHAAEHVVDAWKAAKASDDWTNPLVSPFRSLTKSAVQAQAIRMAELWRRAQVPDALSFSADDLAAAAGVRPEAAAAFTNRLSVSFGQKALPKAEQLIADPITMAALDQLRRKPMLRDGDRFFAVELETLFYALRPLFTEELLASTQAQNYLDHRGRYLEGAVHQLLTSAVAPDFAHAGIKYERTTSAGERLSGEIDSLLRIDDTLVVVEAKSKPLGSAARRAAPRQLEDDLLDDLVRAPVRQLDRACDALKAAGTRFITASGKSIALDLAGVRTVVPIVVTLEEVGTIAASSAFVTPLLGNRGPRPMPWILSFRDLERTCQVLGPARLLLHYAWRRQLAFETQLFAAGEELDLVLEYLPNAQWPAIPAADGGALYMVLDKSQTVEDWLFNEHGLAGADQPTGPPQTEVSNEILSILDEIEGLGTADRLAVQRHLMASHPMDRKRFVFAVRRGDLSEFGAQVGRAVQWAMVDANTLGPDKDGDLRELIAKTSFEPDQRVLVGIGIDSGSIVAACARYASDDEPA